MILNEDTSGQFLVESCGKRPFIHALDLASHRLGQYATASAEEVAPLGTGPTIRAREGTLFRYPSGSGTIYIIDELAPGIYTKRPIHISGWNSKFAPCPGGYTAAISEVTDPNFLNGYANGPTVYDSGSRPDGQLIFSGSGTQYLLENGYRRPFSSAAALTSYDFTQPVCTTNLSPYPAGATLRAREGTLFKSTSSGTQYLIEGQPSAYYKRSIPSLDSLNFFGLGAKTLYTWNDSEVNSPPPVGYTSAAHVHPVKSTWPDTWSRSITPSAPLLFDRSYQCSGCQTNWAAPTAAGINQWDATNTTLAFLEQPYNLGSEIHVIVTSMPQIPRGGWTETVSGGVICPGETPDCPGSTYNQANVFLNNAQVAATTAARNAITSHEFGHTASLAHDGLNPDGPDPGTDPDPDGKCGPPRVPQSIMDYDCTNPFGPLLPPVNWDVCGVNHRYASGSGFAGC